MSQIPPGASDGWHDPYGNYQPGAPPPGYWQASDGRWYPPNPAAAAETQIAPQPPAEQAGWQPPGNEFTPPSPGAPPQGAPPGAPPGFPPQGAQAQGAPPGFPPQGASPQGFPAPNAPGQGFPTDQISPPPNFAPPASQKKSRTALYGVLGLIAFLFVGCTAIGVIALNRGDEEADPTTTTSADDPGGSDTSSGDPASTDSTTDVAASDTTAETTETTARSLAGVTTSAQAGTGAGDAVSCTFTDPETVTVEVVNSGSDVQSYFLTIVFFEGDTRLSDTIAFVNNLRPGERTIERAVIFDQEGSRCEVESADSFPVAGDPSHLGDVSDCAVSGVDVLGDLEAELTVTNSASSTVDYSLQVAFVDDAGIRRGTGFASVEGVAPNQTTPVDVFSFVRDQPGLRCEVVGADRTTS